MVPTFYKLLLIKLFVSGLRFNSAESARVTSMVFKFPKIEKFDINRFYLVPSDLLTVNGHIFSLFDELNYTVKSPQKFLCYGQKYAMPFPTRSFIAQIPAWCKASGANFVLLFNMKKN